MTELDAAWLILCIEAKRAVQTSKTRDELIAACNSPAYRALKFGEADHYYAQAQEEAERKAATYRVVP